MSGDPLLSIWSPNCGGLFKAPSLADRILDHWASEESGVFIIYSDSSEPGSAKFIGAAWGLVPSTISGIEAQMVEDHDDWLELNEGANWFELDGWDPGETQEGAGYGDLYTIPGYWDYSSITPAKAQSLIERWHRREIEFLESLATEEKDGGS